VKTRILFIVGATIRAARIIEKKAGSQPDLPGTAQSCDHNSIRSAIDFVDGLRERFPRDAIPPGRWASCGSGCAGCGSIITNVVEHFQVDTRKPGN
jgi:hypothetical protein